MHNERISYPEYDVENKVWKSPEAAIEEPRRAPFNFLLFGIISLGLLSCAWAGKKLWDKKESVQIQALLQAKLAPLHLEAYHPDLYHFFQNNLFQLSKKTIQAIHFQRVGIDRIEKLWITGFDKEEAQQLIRILGQSLIHVPNISLHHENHAESNRFVFLFKEHAEVTSEKELEIRESSYLTKEVDRQFLEKATQLVREKMGNANFNAEAFREEMGMSKTHFYRKIQEVSQQSPGQFIRSLRLQEAKRLLEVGSGNVSEVAYEVGFNYLSYFSRCFRNEFNILPSEVNA